jgi:hypothetical protein
LSLAVFREWWWPVAIVVLFFGLKTIINMVLEPLLYGRSVGVFPIPLLMMIAFWTWLWGGIGLLLATPMTVCLVVFARHVPQLESVRVLLSDEPAMEPKISYYQRLLAMDVSEASAILRQYLTTGSREQAYDEVLLPALSYAKADVTKGNISRREYHFVLSSSREILTGGDFYPSGVGTSRQDVAASEMGGAARIRIVSCAVQDEADEIALLMLRQLLDPARYEIEVISSHSLASEIERVVVSQKAPPLICIAAVSPGGLAQARYLCKRLRALSSDVKIVVGRWGSVGEMKETLQTLTSAGADQVAASLRETRDQIGNLQAIVRSNMAQ